MSDTFSKIESRSTALQAGTRRPFPPVGTSPYGRSTYGYVYSTFQVACLSDKNL